MVIMLSKSVQHNLQVVIIVSEPNIISQNRTFDHFLLYLQHFLNQRLLECQNNSTSPLKSKLRAMHPRFITIRIQVNTSLTCHQLHKLHKLQIRSPANLHCNWGKIILRRVICIYIPHLFIINKYCTTVYTPEILLTVLMVFYYKIL